MKKKIRFQIKVNKDSKEQTLTYQTNSVLPYSDNPDFTYEFNSAEEIDHLIVNLYMLKKAYNSEI